MKKIICLLVLSMFLLSACSSPASQPSGTVSSPENTRTVITSGNDMAEESISFPPIFYDTVDELISGISNDFNDKFFQEIKFDKTENEIETFKTFITNRKSQNSLYVPFHNGKQMALRDKKGYPNILLCPFNTYFDQPEIWFYPQLDESNSYISISYLNTFLNDDSIKEANEKGASWLLKQIAPDYKNIDNIEAFPSIEKTYEKGIALKDKKVKAIVFEYFRDSRIIYQFVYDDLFITLRARPATLTSEWFSEFSFGKIFISDRSE